MLKTCSIMNLWSIYGDFANFDGGHFENRRYRQFRPYRSRVNRLIYGPPRWPWRNHFDSAAHSRLVSDRFFQARWLSGYTGYKKNWEGGGGGIYYGGAFIGGKYICFDYNFTWPIAYDKYQLQSNAKKLLSIMFRTAGFLFVLTQKTHLSKWSLFLFRTRIEVGL